MPKTIERIALHCSSRSLQKTTFSPVTLLKIETRANRSLQKNEKAIRSCKKASHSFGPKKNDSNDKTKERIPNPEKITDFTFPMFLILNISLVLFCSKVLIVYNKCNLIFKKMNFCL